MPDHYIRFIIRIICVALPVSLFATLFYYMFKQLLLAIKKSRNDLKQIAIDKGHVFTGKLVKTKRIIRSDPARNDDYIVLRVATYEYEYKGKKYKSKLCYEIVTWPDEIELYYIKNPKKATSAGNIGVPEINSWKFFRILFIIMTFFEFSSFYSNL